MKLSVQLGETLRGGRYEIRDHVGDGVDKQVFLARDLSVERDVALDVFTPTAVMPNGLSVSAWEGQILGRFGGHRNIANVIERWEENGAEFMASWYLRGGRLSDRIATYGDRGTVMTADEILRIAAGIASGLEYIHSQGVLHRDIQPKNIVFDEWQTPRIVDFDTACLLDGTRPVDMSGRTGISFMAPEEFSDAALDERADLYSFGATLYAMCIGRPPFDGARAEMLAAKTASIAPSFDRTDVPDGLRELTLALLSADPDGRPASAAIVVKQLDDLRSARRELKKLLSADESTHLEFKATLRVPLDDEPPAALTDEQRRERQAAVERKLELSAMKEIAAFLNTEGGTLVIGVRDYGDVVGIEADYSRTMKPSRDGWCLTFDDVLQNYLGKAVWNWINVQLEPVDDVTVAVIRCRPRKEGTWLGKQEEFFIRRTAGTERLSPSEAAAWLRARS